MSKAAFCLIFWLHSDQYLQYPLLSGKNIITSCRGNTEPLHTNSGRLKYFSLRLLVLIMALKICFQLSGTIFVSVINCRLESKENLVLSHFWLQCCKHLCAGGPTLLKSLGQYNVILIILLYFSSFFTFVWSFSSSERWLSLRKMVTDEQLYLCQEMKKSLWEKLARLRQTELFRYNNHQLQCTHLTPMEIYSLMNVAVLNCFRN